MKAAGEDNTKSILNMSSDSSAGIKIDVEYIKHICGSNGRFHLSYDTRDIVFIGDYESKRVSQEDELLKNFTQGGLLNADLIKLIASFVMPSIYEIAVENAWDSKFLRCDGKRYHIQDLIGKLMWTRYKLKFHVINNIISANSVYAIIRSIPRAKIDLSCSMIMICDCVHAINCDGEDVTDSFIMNDCTRNCGLLNCVLPANAMHEMSFSSYYFDRKFKSMNVEYSFWAARSKCEIKE
jgi:hypothetical protein